MNLVSMTWPEYLAGCCRLNGHLTRLRFHEADVLCALLLSPPECPTSLAQLTECVWPDPDKTPSDPDDTLRSIFHTLRRRGIIIESRRQFGYRIPREARGRETAARLAA